MVKWHIYVCGDVSVCHSHGTQKLPPAPVKYFYFFFGYLFFSEKMKHFMLLLYYYCVVIIILLYYYYISYFFWKKVTKKQKYYRWAGGRFGMPCEWHTETSSHTYICHLTILNHPQSVFDIIFLLCCSLFCDFFHTPSSVVPS